MEQVFFNNVIGTNLEGFEILHVLTHLLSVNARSVLLLLSCFIVLRLVKGSAASRHCLLTVALGAVFVLPVSSYLMPAIDVVVEVSEPIIANMVPAVANGGISAKGVITPEASTLTITVEDLVGGFLSIYLLISLMILGGTIFNNLKMWIAVSFFQKVEQVYWNKALEDCKSRLGVQREVHLRYSGVVTSPATWGVFRPVIMLPHNALQWPDHLIESTLLHELAHIKRCDWLTQQIARCICALYWLNPLCWLAYRKLCTTAENACDDMAIYHGVQKVNYAENLVNVAKNIKRFQEKNYIALGIANIAARSELAMRVMAILNPQSSHQPITRWRATTIFVVTAFLILPLVSLRANYIEKIRVITPLEPAHSITEEVVETPNQVEAFLEESLREDEPVLMDLSIDIEPPLLTAESITTQLNTISAIEVVEKVTSNLADRINRSQEQNVAIPQKVANVVNVVKEGLSVKTQKQESDEFVQTSPDSDVMNTIEEHIEAVEVADVIEEYARKNMVLPKYPSRAQRRGIEGEVVVKFDLNAKGEVVEAQIVSASPTRVFDKHVLKAIKKSTFTPQKVNGEAVSVSGLTEKYTFVLES